MKTYQEEHHEFPVPKIKKVRYIWQGEGGDYLKLDFVDNSSGEVVRIRGKGLRTTLTDASNVTSTETLALERRLYDVRTTDGLSNFYNCLESNEGRVFMSDLRDHMDKVIPQISS